MHGYGKYQTDEEFFAFCRRSREKELRDELRSEREWDERRDEECIKNMKERNDEINIY